MSREELATVCRQLLEEFAYEKEQRNRVVAYNILSDVVVKLFFLSFFFY